MKKQVFTQTRILQGDMLTPITIYLRVRDLFSRSIMLESADYQAGNNSRSYIAFGEMASFSASDATAMVVIAGEKYVEKLSQFFFFHLTEFAAF